MRRKIQLIVVTVLWSLAATLSARTPSRADRIVWVDLDTENITEPSERHTSFAEFAYNAVFIEQARRQLDVERWARLAAGYRKPAANVNALDEVPNSSWYTNRLYLHGMTLEEVARGPDRSSAPDLTDAVVTRAKLEGVTPGFRVKDKRGDEYLLKFDPEGYPELQSAAEVISTKIMYAAGYNTPENYIAYFDANHIRIGEHVAAADEDHKHTLAREDLMHMLEHAPKQPDGRYRVMASKILKGKPKGPFAYIGMRGDDPNDRIPHEHRRELRGLRVLASWISHVDLKEQNTLDMYVDENGRKFLRHYLIDFGTTLGGNQDPLDYSNGREYGFDVRNIFKELFTLGVYTAPSEKRGLLISPSVGIFSAQDFDPGRWVPTVPVIPFQNLTHADAFWATRVMLSFTEKELRAIVGTAQYTHPADADYVVKTLIERQRIVARHWLERVDGLTDFSIEQVVREGLVLRFHDLMMEHHLDASSPQYDYEVRSNGVTSPRYSARETRLLLKPGAAEDLEVTLWTVRQERTSDPVKIHIQLNANGRARISRISRG